MRTIERKNFQISETGAILNTAVKGTTVAQKIFLLFTLIKLLSFGICSDLNLSCM